MLTYVAGLVFSLRTHRDIFNPDYEDEDTWGWSVRTSVIMLAIAGVAVGVMSEILVGSISAASESLGLTEFFIGAIVVAIVGNAAEHWVAVIVARKDKMDLSVNIAIGSSAQIALFVAPLLVLASFFIGPDPMPLVLNGFELAGVVLAVLVANYVTTEGESTWFEGVQLLAVYAVFAVGLLVRLGALRLAGELGQRREHDLVVRLRRDLREDAGDSTVWADDEGRPLNAPVGLAGTSASQPRSRRRRRPRALSRRAA